MIQLSNETFTKVCSIKKYIKISINIILKIIYYTNGYGTEKLPLLKNLLENYFEKISKTLIRNHRILESIASACDPNKKICIR